MADKKYFVLMESGKDTEHIFSGKQPRQAALKAARRGFKSIKLRERGTKKVHVFTGSVKEVSAPANKPSWLPDKIKEPQVKKVGIERL
ncbi:MAG: non-histone chromosomal MC1 family protein [Candidatus Altiarchaeota archaeon]